jgi:hypothetical protein
MVVFSNRKLSVHNIFLQNNLSIIKFLSFALYILIYENFPICGIKEFFSVFHKLNSIPYYFIFVHFNLLYSKSNSHLQMVIES